jgi:hypothetical protein
VGGGCCETNQEKQHFRNFVENYRFLNSSCNLYMSHTLELLKNTFYLKKDTKDGFEEKCLK